MAQPWGSGRWPEPHHLAKPSQESNCTEVLRTGSESGVPLFHLVRITISRPHAKIFLLKKMGKLRFEACGETREAQGPSGCALLRGGADLRGG